LQSAVPPRPVLSGESILAGTNGAVAMSQRTLTVWVLLVYVAAQVTPAFSLAGDSVFGWGATGLSFIGSVLAFADRDVLHEQGYPSACLCGALANLLLLAALAGGFCRRRTWGGDLCRGGSRSGAAVGPGSPDRQRTLRPIHRLRVVDRRHAVAGRRQRAPAGKPARVCGDRSIGVRHRGSSSANSNSSGGTGS
jgi:hypothetical protein